MAVQIRNSQMVDLLTADFVRRDEPAPYLGRVISMYQALPQLRGFWPMSSVDENTDVIDLSFQGRTLTNNNTVTFGATDFFPYASFVSANSEYLDRLDEPGLSVTGSLTIGCWVYFDNAAGSQEEILSKFVVSTGDRSYLINRQAGGGIRFFVSSNGASASAVGSLASTNQNVWYFVAGRLNAGSETSVFLNDIKANLGSGIASIYDSTAPFEVAFRTGTTNYLDGRISLVFICATNLSDALINNLYQQSRVLFGV